MKIIIPIIAAFFVLGAGSVDAEILSKPVGKVIKTSKGTFKIVSIKRPDGKVCTGIDVEELKADINASQKGPQTYWKRERNNGNCRGKCKWGSCCQIAIKPYPLGS